MKTPHCSLLVLAAFSGLSPLACSYEANVDVLKDPCEQMTLDEFEYVPVGPLDAERPVGSFEITADDSGTITEGLTTDAGEVIIDDDDLIDDYPRWIQALAIAEARLKERPDLVDVFESIEDGKPEEDFTSLETEALEFVEAIEKEIEDADLCSRLGENLIGAKPGSVISDGYWPSFTECKDKWDASGDGVIGLYDLESPAAAPQDRALGMCPTVTGGDNRRALNFWGPLSTAPNDVEGLPRDVYDGFPFSGITVPLDVAPYQRSTDRSAWEGVAFWARVAQAEEATPIENHYGVDVYDGREVPADARPQDGVGSVGVIIQTIDTAALLGGRGTFEEGALMDGMSSYAVCDESSNATTYCFPTQEAFDTFPGLLEASDDPDGAPKKYAIIGEDGRPAHPEMPEESTTAYCIDYSPVDTAPGDETPYRDQCWDGFRTMVEISSEWRFFRLPFSEMRQAGWGRVASEFRTDQIKSVNLLASAFQPANVLIDEISFYRRRSDTPAVAADPSDGAADDQPAE